MRGDETAPTDSPKSPTSSTPKVIKELSIFETILKLPEIVKNTLIVHTIFSESIKFFDLIGNNVKEVFQDTESNDTDHFFFRN